MDPGIPVYDGYYGITPPPLVEMDTRFMVNLEQLLSKNGPLAGW